jgi:hypothetical protein
MAKRKAAGSEATKVTKTQAIRDELKANRKAMPKDIAAKLTAQGLSVSASDVSQVKFYLKHAKTKRGRKAAVAAPAPVAPLAEDAISLAALQKAKLLAHELGGVDEAKKALSALARLLD